MILRFQVTGERELAREFEQADARYSDRAWNTLQDYGRQLTSLTRQLAPEAEGFLKSAVRMEPDGDESGWEVGWFGEDFAIVGFDPYFWFVEFGTVDTDAQPSLTVAWEDLAPTLERALEADLMAAFGAT